jgi:hypothetical protein
MKRALLLALASCVGTDSGNPPVLDSGSSGCHDQSYRINKADMASYTPDSRFRGLNCIVWERAEGELRLSATNIDAACGSEDGWRPYVARRGDGGLDLVVHDDECATAGCDSGCLYDVTVTIPYERDLADSLVRAYKNGCDDVDSQGFEMLQGSVAFSQTSGAICRYASYSKVAISGSTGQERGACDQDGACDPGNTCVNLGPNTLCLRACQSDADCDALSRCDGTACQLSATGL